MKDLNYFEYELYQAKYNDWKSSNKEAITLWEEIKTNPDILKEAIEIKKDKFNEHDLIKGPAIAELILIDYQSIDKEIYNNLINTIYSNVDIVRGFFRKKYNTDSFLLLSLINPNLKLTEEQKAFVINETMSPSQAHGFGAYNIRYYILRNPNWTLEEKQKLIMNFWKDDDEYDETIEEWEWDIVNDTGNYKDKIYTPFDRYELFYEWSYDMLLAYHKDKEITDRIWEEMEFCKQMHKLRPQQWEIQNIKKLTKYFFKDRQPSLSFLVYRFLCNKSF